MVVMVLVLFPKKISIKKAINTLYSPDFRKILSKKENPYGKGGATEKIMEIIKNLIIPKQLKKDFYNL